MIKEKHHYANSEETHKIKKSLNIKKESLLKTKDILEKKYYFLGKKYENSRFKNVKKMFSLNKQIERKQKKLQQIEIDFDRLDNNKYEILPFFKKMKKILQNIPYQKQKIICGIIFLVPWMLGFCLFFAKPLIMTIWYSFNNIKLNQVESFAGFDNYSYLFNKQLFDSSITFSERIFVAIKDASINVAIILIFSLFIAVVLNTKFKGHQIFKAIFFIPVVYNISAINTALNGTYGNVLSEALSENVSLSAYFASFLSKITIAEGLMEFLITAVDTIFTIVNKSGIQILIFIAALQGIPKHLYEASKVEGATAYESFWKITFPMVSPMFLPVIVFTAVDSFTSSAYAAYLQRVGFASSEISTGVFCSAAVMYFLVNFIFIGLFFVIFRKLVHYND